MWLLVDQIISDKPDKLQGECIKGRSRREFTRPWRSCRQYEYPASVIVSPDTTDPRQSGSGDPLANARGSESTGETMTEANDSLQIVNATDNLQHRLSHDLTIIL